MERLNNYQTKQLIRLAGSQERLEELSGRADTLNQEMKTLRDGTRIQELQRAEHQLLQEAKELGEALEHIQAEQIRSADRHGNLKKTFQELEGHLRELEIGFVPDPSFVEEVQMVLERQEAVSFKRQKQKELFRLKEQEEEETDQLFLARNQFNRAYPMYGFTSNEKENQVYDQLLAECRRDFQPAYKEEFENQCAMVYRSCLLYTSNPELKPIACATVHQFQGPEKDVIVYDAVDCYRIPYPGMLLTSTGNNYANRLFNVALTRAKGKFIGVANIAYMDNKNLSSNLMFERVIEGQRRKPSCLTGQELSLIHI